MACHHIAAVAGLVGQSPTRKALLFALAYAVDCDGHWMVDRNRLAQMSGLSERSMRQHMKDLVASGTLFVSQTTGRLRLIL